MGRHTTAQAQPPQAPPPSDAALASAIEGMAAFVARSGPEFERLAQQKHRGEALFAFLGTEGAGRAYYLFRLWHHRNLLRLAGHLPADALDKEAASGARAPPMDAERRREMLGENALTTSPGAVSPSPAASVAGRSAATPAHDSRGQSSFGGPASAPPTAAPSPAAAELAALMAARFQSAGVEVSPMPLPLPLTHAWAPLPLSGSPSSHAWALTFCGGLTWRSPLPALGVPFFLWPLVRAGLAPACKSLGVSLSLPRSIAVCASLSAGSICLCVRP